jgi:hypothetical protein
MRTFGFTTTPEDLITKTVESGTNTWTYAYNNDHALTSAKYSTGLAYGVTLNANGNMTALTENLAGMRRVEHFHDQ